MTDPDRRSSGSDGGALLYWPGDDNPNIHSLHHGGGPYTTAADGTRVLHSHKLTGAHWLKIPGPGGSPAAIYWVLNALIELRLPTAGGETVAGTGSTTATTTFPAGDCCVVANVTSAETIWLAWAETSPTAVVGSGFALRPGYAAWWLVDTSCKKVAGIAADGAAFEFFAWIQTTGNMANAFLPYRA